MTSTLELLQAFRGADCHESLEDWTGELGARLSSVIGARAYQLLRVLDGGARLEVVAAGGDAAADRILDAGHGSLDERQQHQLYRSGSTVVCISDVFRGGPCPTELRAAMLEVGVGDVLGLVGPCGVSAGFYLPKKVVLDARARQSWIAAARYLGVGIALRTEEDTERFLDDDLPSKLRGALAELERRRVVHGSGRGKHTNREAESAFAFYSALADEGFAVVEEVCVGGRRRFVAARAKDAGARAVRGLDGDERSVLALLRDGASLKEICFELGIPETTLSGRLTRIRAKLGIDPRAPLAHLAAFGSRRTDR